ncbi:MAG: PEP/pyruvate-binding domain-containing protein, partial [Candidatus Eisenbacteria bacterium]|nr:PEP/pyruvate-binding domain-containing protein [Candidatus Eisenbacteria bacterium]
APPAESTPGARLLAGTIVSGGRAAGLARFGTTGRKPADLDGAILVSATLRPEDNTFLYRASGIVSTGGAILSHAGLLALQFRKPALLVPGEPRLDSGGSWSLPFERFEEEETVSEVRGVPIRARSRRSLGQDRLREGDLLVLDAESGTLEVLGQDPDALALRAALSTLADCERRLGSAADEAELLEIRGRRLRARHQLGRLLDRIEDPRLAVFAIDEIGRIAPEDAALASSRGALLRNLLANPRVGAAAGQRIGAVARERTGRRERLLAETEAAVASSGDPLEILMLRRRLLEVFKSAREAEALRDAAFDEVGCAAASEPARASSPSSAPGGFHSPGRVEGLERREGFERRESLESLDRLDRLDRLAGRRLRILRDRLAEELAASGCLDLANGEQLARARGRLEALSLLDTLLPAGAGRGEIRRSRDARANAIREAIEARDCERAALLGEKIVLDPMDGGYEMLPWIGSKAANLTRVAHLLGPRPVPPWFAVTDFALRWTMAAPLGDGQAGTLREAIDGILADPDTTDAQKSWMISKLWEAASIPEPVAAAIVEAYRRLGGPGCPDRDTGMPFVAVRSSGLEEDTSAATRAGEFETFLMVRGERELLSHVRRAWSGFWTERAIHN